MRVGCPLAAKRSDFVRTLARRLSEGVVMRVRVGKFSRARG
jgi:hypothetical protein